MTVRSSAYLLALGVVAISCGGRAELEPPEVVLSLAFEQAAECLSDTDCTRGSPCAPDRCIDATCQLVPVECDDGDPCSLDVCEPASGECRATPLTVDEDEDGFRRPLPGMLPGEEGACGNDCNDTSALARPGGVELCDGVDNDCDGVVDNGALFTPSAREPLLLSSGADVGIPAGIAYAEAAEAYGVVYTHRESGTQNRLSLVSSADASPSRAISDINSDTFAGTVTWTGAVFGTAWEDRRDSDYEIYFNRLTAEGEKLGPDLRVSSAPGFSLRPSLVFNGTYTLVWEDHRDSGGSRIFAQHLSAAGEPIGSNRALTPPGLQATAPVVALGGRRLGMVFGFSTGEQGYGLAFRSFGVNLEEPSVVIPIPAPDAAGGSVVYNGEGRFVVTWHVDNGVSPGPSIYGAVLSEEGEWLVTPRAITEPAPFARYHSVVPFGDRLYVVWSQWGEDQYNLRAQELGADLTALGPAEDLTSFAGGAYGPIAARGNDEIGIVFSGKTSPGEEQHAYFASLSCREAPSR